MTHGLLPSKVFSPSFWTDSLYITGGMTKFHTVHSTLPSLEMAGGTVTFVQTEPIHVGEYYIRSGDCEWHGNVTFANRTRVHGGRTYLKSFAIIKSKLVWEGGWIQGMVGCLVVLAAYVCFGSHGGPHHNALEVSVLCARIHWIAMPV